MPRSGQAQWKLKRKGAKATILLGRGGREGPAERDGAPGKGLVPALMAQSLASNPGPAFENWKKNASPLGGALGERGWVGSELLNVADLLKVLTKVSKVCSLTGIQGDREGSAYEGVENSPPLSYLTTIR